MLKHPRCRRTRNAPIQGTAADSIKMATRTIYAWLREGKRSTRMILPVDDELVFDAVAEEMACIPPPKSRS